MKNEVKIETICKEGVCPICGGELAYSGVREDDDNGCAYPWTCNNCGATGKEGYSLSFDGNHYNVMTEDGSSVEIICPKTPELKNIQLSADFKPVKAEDGWVVPVTWEMFGVVRIPFEDAPTLADAFMQMKANPDIELPKGHYVDDSFAPSYDMEQIEDVRSLYNNNRKDPEINLTEIAKEIVSLLENSSVDSCTNTSGCFTIYKDKNGDERFVEVYKSSGEGIEPVHYTVYCHFEDGNFSFEYSDDLSAESLEKVLRELVAD